MTKQYFKIDEYFNTNGAKKELAFFVLADRVFKTEAVQNIQKMMLNEDLTINTPAIHKATRETVSTQVDKLRDEFAYPFEAAPINFIVMELMDSQRAMFNASVGAENYGKPTTDIQHFINIANNNKNALEDLNSLFGQNDE